MRQADPADDLARPVILDHGPNGGEEEHAADDERDQFGRQGVDPGEHGSKDGDHRRREHHDDECPMSTRGSGTGLPCHRRMIAA